MKRKNTRHQESEQATDVIRLDHEIPEDFRETNTQMEEDINIDTSKNDSQPEDRSEDLINETDPFIQQPEKDSQIPPELLQQRAYHLYEQRNGISSDNLADWFEAERQLRQERL